MARGVYFVIILLRYVHGIMGELERHLGEDVIAELAARLRLRMLPDPHIINLHRVRRLGGRPSRIIKD